MLKRISEKNNFVFLTTALVLLLFTGAIVDEFPTYSGPHLVQTATILVLAVGAWGQRQSQSRLVVNIVFLVVVLALVFGGDLLEQAGFSIAHLLLMLGFFGWTTWIATQQVLFTGSIDTNKIIGAICIYMLLALVWAMLYLLIAQLEPGAFNGIPMAPWVDNFATAVYFSFVTITTLGYGDISPVSPMARFLVIMEATVGVFYMAILVASLIGVRISSRDNPGKPG